MTSADAARSLGPPADLYLTGGTILTMDAAMRRADALWIRGDRVAAVGSAAEVEARMPVAAQHIDLAGATVLPGFVDAHCHIGALAYVLGTVDCAPEAAPSIEDVVKALEQSATTGAPGTWIAGHSFAENAVLEGRFLTRHDLDRAVRDRPAVVFHRSMHACILNTRGLEVAGLDLAEDPPYGKLGREPDGRPDGTVYEAPMFALFARLATDDLYPC